MPIYFADPFTDTNLASRYDYIEESGAGTTGDVSVQAGTGPDGSNALHVGVTATAPHYSIIKKNLPANTNYLRLAFDAKVKPGAGVNIFYWCGISQTGGTGWLELDWDGSQFVLSNGDYAGTYTGYPFVMQTDAWHHVDLIQDCRTSPRKVTLRVDLSTVVSHADAAVGLSTIPAFTFDVGSQGSGDNVGDIWIDNLIASTDPSGSPSVSGRFARPAMLARLMR